MRLCMQSCMLSCSEYQCIYILVKCIYVKCTVACLKFACMNILVALQLSLLAVLYVCTSAQTRPVF